MNEQELPAVAGRAERTVRPRAGTAAYVRQALKREAAYVAEVEHLRAWIKHIGLSADICTRNALGEVCENCRCKHALKGLNARTRPSHSGDTKG